MFSLSDTRFFKLTTHLKRTAHFFQTEGQVALIQRIDGYEPAQYPLLRCKGTHFFAIHQAFTHYFQKLFDFEHFAFQGATLVNRQNVLLSTYSVAESSLQLPYFRFPQRVGIHPVVFYIRDSKIFIGGIFLD